MKSYKICALTPYYPPIKGGISSYLSNLMSELEDLNFDTIVISRYGNIDKKIHIINQKIYFVIKSYLILCNFKPDIIHAHSNWYTLVPAVAYKIHNHKTRLIFTFHTEPVGKMKNYKKQIFQRLLLKCDTVTFVSIALKNKLEKNYQIKTNKKVIYCGVSTNNNLYEEEIIKFANKFSLKNNNPIITFVGPLVWKQKVEGVKILIKSFEIVKKMYPNAKLMIVGDGVYKEELEQLSKELNIYDIVFTGFLDNVFIPLKLTDIYAHITLQEGFPIALLEAMSLGKPVIATKVGGIPEIIENYENGILTEADPEIIGKEIINLYQNKTKMKDVGEKARRTIEKSYSWEIITKEYIEIYKGE